MRFEWGWSPKPKVHFAIGLSMSVIAAAIALYLYIDAHRILRESELVNGVVVESVIGANGMHTPRIEYSTSDGQTHQFLSRFSSSPQIYFVGDSIEVILQGGEHRPQINDFFTIYGLPAFAAMFSLICFIGTIGIYFLRVRPLRAESTSHP